MAKKALNIGMVGYGFMGRTHSNAFSQAPHFFDLGYKPVLKTICARNPDKARDFADQWGYEFVADFVRAIRTGAHPPVTLDDGYRVLQIIDAAYESSRTGRRIDLQ